MATADKVSAYDGLTLPLRKDVTIETPGTANVDIPITMPGSLTAPSYKGTGAGEAPASEVVPTGATHRTEVTGGAGASSKEPRHMSRWNRPEKGPSGANPDSVTGNSPFSGQSVRRCKITSITVVRVQGASSFQLSIFTAAGREAITLVAATDSGGTQRIDIPSISLDYRDDTTNTKGADGTIYCQLVTAASGLYQIKLEVEPL